ncbi:MAG: hypothetical protein ACLFNC_02955 [Halodesulfurarchaeum sp.]
MASPIAGSDPERVTDEAALTDFDGTNTLSLVHLSGIVALFDLLALRMIRGARRDESPT